MSNDFGVCEIGVYYQDKNMIIVTKTEEFDEDFFLLKERKREIGGIIIADYGKCNMLLFVSYRTLYRRI